MKDRENRVKAWLALTTGRINFINHQSSPTVGLVVNNLRLVDLVCEEMEMQWLSYATENAEECREHADCAGNAVGCSAPGLVKPRPSI